MHSSKLFLEASALLLCWTLVQATPAAQQALDGLAQERLFSSKADPCKAWTGRAGECRTGGDCIAKGGVAQGNCGFLGFGVCCVPNVGTVHAFICGSKTSNNEFTFANPVHPNEETEILGDCKTTVTTKSTTCQLRLDLTEFSIAPPDNDGKCPYTLEVVGSTIPPICGKNAGQHVYVDVSSSSDVDIKVMAQNGGEKWEIKVTQIACDSEDKAPFGCSQYYTETSGTITSYNYNPSSDFGTRQLADQSYGACIKQQEGFCSVTYTQADGSVFSLSTDPKALSPALPPPASEGQNCGGDYLLIPGSTIVDNSNFGDPKPTQADRFCGLSFPGATTSIMPFKINYITDGEEAMGGDSNNEGFQLSYELNACR